MSEETFLESLGEQADAEIARILGEADAGARRLLEEAEATASREEGEWLWEAGIRAELLRARILNEARAEARRTMLEAAHRLSAEALARVAGRAETRLGEEGGAALLEALLAECLIAGGCRVLCRPPDRASLEEAARRRGLEVTFEERDLPSGGVVVVSGDGRFVQTNTVGERLRRARPLMMRAIAGTLAGLAGAGGSRA